MKSHGLIIASGESEFGPVVLLQNNTKESLQLVKIKDGLNEETELKAELGWELLSNVELKSDFDLSKHFGNVTEMYVFNIYMAQYFKMFLLY